MHALHKNMLLVLIVGVAAGCAHGGLRREQREAASLMVYLDKPEVSSEEKSAALETFLEERADDAIPDAQRWREYLTQRLRSASLGLDEGLRTGDLLRKIATVEASRQLETHYVAHRRDLAEGNKVAIVMAALNGGEFLESVLSDSQDFMHVREAAFERMAELGYLAKAQEIALRVEDPTLAATATRVGALYAKDQETLANIAEAAKHATGLDEHGRDPLDTAHVAISESNVSGKSVVLLRIWETGIQQILARETSEAERSHTAVAGIAMAHAIWSEGDVAFVSGFLAESLRPLLKSNLASASAKKSVHALQVVADFSSQFRRECESRPVEACSDAKDPRVALSTDLRGLLVPHLANTELAFYLRAWE
jgi:hypothetical protein